MQVDIVFVAILAAIVLAGVYAFAWPALYRRWIVSRTFPGAWLKILAVRLPVYDKLPAALKQELRGLIQVFIRTKRFVGCAGLVITDEIRVTIAAQACLLLLNRPTYEYADVRFIYVYPTGFRATRDVRDEIGLVRTESRDLLGESWRSGKVILAWDEVEHGARNFADGHNVVLHEFAHQLDEESGVANGAPLLYTKAAYKSWAWVFGQEFARLQRNDPDEPSLLDRYGATNPAEFFAVATETFFEEPHKMYAHPRELFEELHGYYRLDPREWT